MKRIARLCNPEIKYLDLLASLELWKPNILGAQNYLVASGGTNNKKAVVIYAKKWIHKVDLLNILLYIDGS